MYINFCACVLQLFLVLQWLSVIYTRSTGYEEDGNLRDNIGSISIRDCFYILNVEGSSILHSHRVSMDPNLGAIIAVDKNTEKKIYNASSQLWYLSPKTGQLLNMWEKMFQMEPYLPEPRPEYVCLRPGLETDTNLVSWIIKQDTLKDGHLIIKHEASERLLTFNGKNLSVSLEPPRDVLGKGGLSAIIHKNEPVRLRYASYFYQKPMSTVDSDSEIFRTPVTDQRWMFEPIVENLFLIVTSVDNNKGGHFFLAIADILSIDMPTSHFRMIKASTLNVDDLRQMWFREKSTEFGDVIRNFATGNILDAALKPPTDNNINPIFDLPPIIPDEDEESEEEEEDKSTPLSVYLVSAPYIEKTKSKRRSLPLWLADSSKKRWSIRLPNALKLRPQKPQVIFSAGKTIFRKSREERTEDVLSDILLDCKNVVSSLTPYKDKSQFAISLAGEDSVMLEQILHDTNDNNDFKQIPSRQLWIELPLSKADDPLTLSRLFT